MITAFDSNVLIYFLENDREFGEAARDAFADAMEHGQAVVSTVGVAEFFSVKHSAAELDKFDKFSQLITIVPLDADMAKRAGRIRSSRQSLKLPDALHLATGLESGADVIITNDLKLCKLGSVDGLKIKQLA